MSSDPLPPPADDPAAPLPPSPGGPGAAAPAPADARPTLARMLGNLGTVLRFARPRWVGLVLALALMGVEAATSAGRIFLFFPIMTRVLEVGAAGEGGSPGNEASQLLATARDKMGPVLGAYDGLIDRMNALTGTWVPDESVADAARGLQGEAASKAVARARDRYATLASVSLLFVAFIAIMCLAAYLESYVAAKVSLDIAMDVRREVTRKLLDQPVAFYDRQRRGELVQRSLGDVDAFYTWLTLLLNAVIKGVVQLVATAFFLVAISPQLTLICLAGLPFLLPMRTLTRRTLKRSHRRQQETTRRVESLLQIFGGIRVIKAFGSERERLAEFDRADREVARASLKVQRAKSTADALIEFINNFLALVLAVGGGWLVLTGKLDVSGGQLVVFLFLMANLYQPVKKLVKSINSLQDSAASVERTQEYLALPPPPPDAPGAVAFPGVREAVRFEQVSFAYVPGRPVLHEVSFILPRGGVVAVVGRTGAGKSTLCDLLLRFYDPDTGRITVDGRDVRGFTRASYIARTAVVQQVPFLFHTTIAENIRQGRSGADDAAVQQAARDAQIHAHIASLPQGYAEEVGEAG
ncbi:MAG: ABC transporter ATP-binding protein, partial [Candidatus Sericytochromatia bacterium]|nr:ABC transporter ATP-binding protein [Candidatus Sericytochromatia bacterium]